MKKGLAGFLSIIGILFVILAVLGIFGVMELGTFKWIALVLGILFMPAGISLMKTTKSSS